jgi:hypothetical protein
MPMPPGIERPQLSPWPQSAAWASVVAAALDGNRGRWWHLILRPIPHTCTVIRVMVRTRGEFAPHRTHPHPIDAMRQVEADARSRHCWLAALSGVSSC